MYHLRPSCLIPAGQASAPLSCLSYFFPLSPSPWPLPELWPGHCRLDHCRAERASAFPSCPDTHLQSLLPHHCQQSFSSTFDHDCPCPLPTLKSFSDSAVHSRTLQERKSAHVVVTCTDSEAGRSYCGSWLCHHVTEQVAQPLCTSATSSIKMMK